MQVIAKAGREDIATVYIAEMENGKLIEFVESVQPPIPKEEKWVLIISTLYGCPVACRFCDAGNDYKGKLSYDDIFFQIDYLIKKSFPDRKIPIKKFKIQFSRMGEPAFNNNVLDILDDLPTIYDARGLMPSISTVAPAGTDKFFERLLEIKNKYYNQKFQFQFSIHTTDIKLREWLIPIKTWSFEQMSEYAKSFYKKGDRKITLNFALAEGMSIDPNILLQYFSPELFLIKITPVNPTYKANKNNISSAIQPQKEYGLVDILSNEGYDVILSIGELEENQIGSNCGQYITNYKKETKSIKDGYTYNIQEL